MVRGSTREIKSVGPGPLAKKLKELRTKAGITLYELEKRSGVNRAKLLRIEHGTIRYPTERTLNKLADAFGVERAVFHDIAATGRSGPLLSLPAYLERKFGFDKQQISEVEALVNRIQKDANDIPKAA